MKVDCPLTACKLAEQGEMLSRLVMVFSIAFFDSFSHECPVLEISKKEILNKESYFVYNIPSSCSADVVKDLCAYTFL